MRRWLVRLRPKSAFVRNVGLLTSGTVFAQGLSVLALPVLTRLYSPDAFGLLSVYMALIGLLTVVSCLRLNIAIPLPEQDEDAMNLLALALAASVLVSVALVAVVVALPQAVTVMLGQPKMEPYLWMIPAGVFLASVYNALQYWSTRRRRFLLVTRTRISRALGGAGLQVSFGAISGGPFGLLLGHMAYGGLGVFALARDLWRADRSLLGAVSLRSASAALRTYRHFPSRSVPAAVLDAGYQFFPILIMASAIGAAEMGLVFLAIRTMAIPISLIGSSISQVYLADASARLAAGDLGAFTRRIMVNLFRIGAPVLVAIGMIAYFFFGWVFGEEFGPAGTMVLWMTPWFIVQLVCSPVSAIFAASNRQAEWLALQALGFLIIIGGTIIALYLFPDHVVEVFSLANFVFYAVVVMAILTLTYRIRGDS